MLVIERLYVPHCYDVEYIIHEFSKCGIDLSKYITREDLDIFVCNCLKAMYFRFLTKVGSHLSIKVVTNSFRDWIDDISVGSFKKTSDNIPKHKQSQFSLKLVEKGYQCTLYRTSSQIVTIQHRCILCRKGGTTANEFLKENPDILKYPIKMIEDGLDKYNFDLSKIKPVFDTRELPKLLRYECLRTYILKILGGENPCNAEVIPLNF